MNIHSLLKVIIRPFRKSRMEKFMNIMAPSPEATILDVGGTAYNWSFISHPGKIVILNIDIKENSSSGNISYVQGDGTMLQYPDKSFDIIFSNSVIEHLSTAENQMKFASEVSRCGRSIWVQTPARSFFIEPHFLTPFIHYLPKRIMKKALRNFSLWGMLTRPSQEYVDNIVDEIRLLGFEEMKSLFPDCEIIRERFMLFTKSYIAIRKSD